MLGTVIWVLSSGVTGQSYFNYLKGSGQISPPPPTRGTLSAWVEAPRKDTLAWFSPPALLFRSHCQQKHRNLETSVHLVSPQQVSRKSKQSRHTAPSMEDRLTRGWLWEWEMLKGNLGDPHWCPIKPMPHTFGQVRTSSTESLPYGDLQFPRGHIFLRQHLTTCSFGTGASRAPKSKPTTPFYYE